MTDAATDLERPAPAGGDAFRKLGWPWRALALLAAGQLAAGVLIGVLIVLPASTRALGVD
jgi:hypothetical protein